MHELAKAVLQDRYLLPNEDTWEDVAHRVSKAVAVAEKPEDREEWEKCFFNTINSKFFLPGGRILRSAGAPYGTSTWFNCFHIPLVPEDKEHGRDSLQSILDTLKRTCHIAAAGGGLGITLSVLRPKGAKIRGTGGYSLGPVSWLPTFDSAVSTLTQSGSRRAALLMLLHDWHPDVMEYIEVKQDITKLQHMNLSVAISDDFIKAVKEDGEWDLVFPDTTHPDYDKLWDGNLKKWKEEMGLPITVYKTIKARELWSKICYSAWACAEPGLIMLDRANEQNNLEDEFIAGCNACAEQVLPEWGVCNLGSLNLSALSDDSGYINYALLKSTIRTAVRFLDDVIDLSPYLYLQIEQTQKHTRRIGLGTMGLADLLIKRHVCYGSAESLELIDSLYKTIANEAYGASTELAKEKGTAPAYTPAILNRPFLKQLDPKTRASVLGYGLRNCVLLSAPPTGTTSIVAEVASGIEPVFAFEYKRHDRTGVHLVHHSLYAKWKEEHPEEPLPDYFVTAHDVTLEEHIRVQAVLQKWVDASISKTLNAPTTLTPKKVEEAFLLAYNLGLKTITFYRDGCREGVLRKLDVKDEDTDKTLPRGKVLPRPKSAPGYTFKLDTGCGKLYLTINYDPETKKILETFITTGSDGGCLIYTEATSRLISLALRGGIPLEKIIEQLENTHSCPSFMHARGAGKSLSPGKSCPSAIAQQLRVVKERLIGLSVSPTMRKLEQKQEEEDLSNRCPECGNELTSLEGCRTCFNCGWSSC